MAVDGASPPRRSSRARKVHSGVNWNERYNWSHGDRPQWGAASKRKKFSSHLRDCISRRTFEQAPRRQENVPQQWPRPEPLGTREGNISSECADRGDDWPDEVSPESNGISNSTRSYSQIEHSEISHQVNDPFGYREDKGFLKISKPNLLVSFILASNLSSFATKSLGQSLVNEDWYADNTPAKAVFASSAQFTYKCPILSKHSRTYFYL
jgi:hypothetical protein